jgi:pimeloyl-ACP methyl ester carboxylesterase
MGIGAAALVATVLWAHERPGPASIEPETFRSWFEAAYYGELELPKAVVRRARTYRYVFVAGFHNEKLGDYFARNVAALKAHGIPTDAIHEIDPSSHRRFEENVAAIWEAFRSIAAEGPEPLVVIAHSRGACDALAFALRHPQFVRDRVAYLFLIQGPFGGSAAADYVLGQGEPIDGRIPPRPRALGRMMGRIERNALRRGRHEGLMDLTHDAAEAFWNDELETHVRAVPIVGPRTYYLESQASAQRSRPLLRPIARYVETYYGPGDGIVSLDDQSLPDLGTRLGVIAAAHHELVGGPASSPAGRKARRALMECLIMAVGQECAQTVGLPGRGREE